ncbi:hypothetical protein TIFTF001_056300 [Ficus carica]|uniref:Uncharacterized protein n=1 Tax=Ficus carica TaxID=3494 RepID=A0AA88JJI0_FICCA|nr:hypothetical protein TIFTF001_056300 [Ficus carica]
MLAEVCCAVLEGQLTLPGEDEPPLPKINENPVVDLVAAPKSTSVAFEFPTKRRGTTGKPPFIKKEANLKIKTAATHKIHDVDEDDQKRLISKKSGATRPKRRRLDEGIKTEVNTKKRNTKNSGKRGVRAGPDPAPPMPENLREMVVRDFDVSTVTFVIQKSLFQTDLEKVESRLSMTLKQIASDDFLTEEEKRTLVTRKTDGGLEGIKVGFIEPDKELRKTEMMLKKWDSKSSSSYIWFFRSKEGKPCLAVVNLGQEPASCSSSAVGKDDNDEPRSDVTS